MVSVKVYLFTYRRNKTLKRSIQSLIGQTHANWVCEVHNDDPKDLFPGQYIASLNDNRFSIVNHPFNYGPVTSFNLAFNNCDETYVSILEDDNWWEPEFLQTMIQVLELHGDSQIAWTNMNLWKECADDKWIDLKNTVWPITNEKVTIFSFPQFRQTFNALHSNGAMLTRNGNLNLLKSPENIRFDFIEQIRERAFQHPIILVTKPLANFAITISTSRPNSFDGMFEHYLLLIDSFFKYAGNKEGYSEFLWEDARQAKLRSYIKLLFTGLTCKSSRSLLKYASPKEWCIFFMYNVKYPFLLYRCINAKKTYSALWDYLSKKTEERFAEANG